jgi:hypothetical protein
MIRHIRVRYAQQASHLASSMATVHGVPVRRIERRPLQSKDRSRVSERFPHAPSAYTHAQRSRSLAAPLQAVQSLLAQARQRRRKPAQARRFVNPGPTACCSTTPLARPATWRLFSGLSRAHTRLGLSNLPAARLSRDVGRPSTRNAHAEHRNNTCVLAFPRKICYDHVYHCTSWKI